GLTARFRRLSKNSKSKAIISVRSTGKKTRIQSQRSGDFKSAAGCPSPESWTNKHCAHCVPVPLLPLRRRTRRNLSGGRMREPQTNNRKKPRLRRAKHKLLERNRYLLRPGRVFLAGRPTKWRRRNYNSVSSSAPKRCCGAAVSTKVLSTGSSARTW